MGKNLPLLHGGGDQVVDARLSRNAYEKLVSCQVEAELVVIEGMPHAFEVGLIDDDEKYEELIVAPVKFLRRHVDMA